MGDKIGYPTKTDNKFINAEDTCGEFCLKFVAIPIVIVSILVTILIVMNSIG